MIDKYVRKSKGEFYLFRGQVSPRIMYLTVGPRGAKQAGFDMEFDITHAEGLELFRYIYRKKLRECTHER